jgi:hypothetical protein
MLNWSRADLSRVSGVSERSLAAFESEGKGLMKNNHAAVRQAFETAGVEFTVNDGVMRRTAAKERG